MSLVAMIHSNKWIKLWRALGVLEEEACLMMIFSKMTLWWNPLETQWIEWWDFLIVIDFSRLVHQKAHRNGKEGSYVCQTFVSSSTVGPDGKVNTHNYFENSAGEHKNGKTISQKHQAYKDSNGVKRIAEERMLNDKGHKIVK